MTLSAERVHEATVQLLERTGVAFHAEPGLAVFRSHGLRVEGPRVFIPEGRLAACLETAPPAFILAGRGRGRDLQIGRDRPVLATASGCPFVLDEYDQVRPGSIADFEKAVKLGHLLEPIDMNGQSVEALDVPVEGRYRRAIFAALTLSDKAIEYPMALPSHLDVAFDTLEIVAGAAWDERVRMMSVVNSLSPLAFSLEMTLAAVGVARRGQAVCVTPSAMAGITAPATLAGVLVVQNAEVLAGLVLAQLVRPGCPVIYGGTSSIASMARGDFLTGVPEYWQLVEATVDMARHYGLPCRTGGALTDAHRPDFQAGMESALSLAAALRAGADFVLHAAGVLSTFTVLSLAKLVLDVELAGGLRAALRPVSTSEEDLAVEVIERVVQGEAFVTDDHTLRHCHDHDHPGVMNRANRDTWLRRGARDAAAAGQGRVEQLLEAYVPPEMDAITLRQLADYCLR